MNCRWKVEKERIKKNEENVKEHKETEGGNGRKGRAKIMG